MVSLRGSVKSRAWRGYRDPVIGRARDPGIQRGEDGCLIGFSAAAGEMRIVRRIAKADVLSQVS
jgi:hypothetical protein